MYFDSIVKSLVHEQASWDKMVNQFSTKSHTHKHYMYLHTTYMMMMILLKPESTQNHTTSLMHFRISVDNFRE